eukprot:GHVS01044888.1.p1 GENE.GHVS01044888.1~~GHVS01044888.1.p1  ORF type:complete len:204 (-),score=58.96 GHVS01044888.1:161-772(-)
MDPYAVLGVSASASLEEIRRAFRQKALACHPDKVQHYKQQQQPNNSFLSTTATSSSTRNLNNNNNCVEGTTITHQQRATSGVVVVDEPTTTTSRVVETFSRLKEAFELLTRSGTTEGKTKIIENTVNIQRSKQVGIAEICASNLESLFEDDCCVIRWFECRCGNPVDVKLPRLWMEREQQGENIGYMIAECDSCSLCVKVFYK